MASYLIPGTPSFTPFTYDELVKPIEHIQEQHDKAQEAYDTLNLETSALGDYISEQNDPITYQKYNNYLQRLSELQNNLWTNGFTPQTNRDLSAARKGYAGDITAITKAIQTRQERSKEYWDARHKDPSLVTGNDPMQGSLDNYLGNLDYGQNWYSYSGNAFVSEVGADAKARASEMLRNPEIQKDPKLVGYLEAIMRTGFTNKEVDNAFNAVSSYYGQSDRNSTALSKAYSKLTPSERILADVLVSHVNSINAEGNVSDDDFGRLLNYGRMGLSQAVGQAQVQFLQFLQDLNPTGSSADVLLPQTGTGYTWGNIYERMTRQGYDKYERATRGTREKYADGKTYTLTKPDGTAETFASDWALGRAVYGYSGRQNFLRDWGLDVAMPGVDWKNDGRTRQVADITLSSGRKVRLSTGRLSNKDADRLGLPHGSVAVYAGKDNLNDTLTVGFNKTKAKYEQQVEAWKKANPDFVFEEYAITPKKEWKLRKDNNIDYHTSFNDLEDVLTTKNQTADYVPATLVGTDPGFNRARGLVGERIIAGMNSIKNQINEKSVEAFHKIDDNGNTTTEGKGITDPKKLFGDSLNPDLLSYVTIQPEDIAVGKDRFRIMTKGAEGIYSAPISLLGDDVEAALNNPTAAGYSPRVIISYAMMPLLHPEQAMDLSDNQAQAYMLGIYNVLNNLESNSPKEALNTIPYKDFLGPYRLEKDQNGNNYPVLYTSVKDIVRDPYAQEQLRKSVLQYLNTVLAMPRDTWYLAGERGKSSNSENAQPYSR